MIIPGVLAQQALLASGGGGTLWTPLNMATVPAIYLHMNDSVITDVSGAASNVTNLGSLGVNGDFSQTASANCPSILAGELNGKRVLRFDGSNDVLLCGTPNVRNILRARTHAWSFVVVKKLAADGAPTYRNILNIPNSIGSSQFSHWIGYLGTGEQNKPRFFCNPGSGTVTFSAPTQSFGSFDLLLSSVNLSSGSCALYRNGSLDASSSIATGSFADAAIAPGTPISIGARYDGTVWPADIDIAAIIVGNTVLSTDERQRLEGWAAHEWGLAANLPAGHPYKTSPPMV